MENFYSLSADFARKLWSVPSATASIEGGNGYEQIRGRVNFYRTNDGIIVSVELVNMPYDDKKCGVNFHGFHIHDGKSCTGNEKDNFANSGMHYNPDDCKHPAHAGDLVPLVSSKGYVWQNFLINSFTIDEIIGKIVVIHKNPDDFKTQPAGDSGTKIACGEIRRG